MRIKVSNRWHDIMIWVVEGDELTEALERFAKTHKIERAVVKLSMEEALNQHSVFPYIMVDDKSAGPVSIRAHLVRSDLADLLPKKLFLYA